MEKQSMTHPNAPEIQKQLDMANELLNEARSALSYAYEQRSVKDIAHTLSKLNEHLKGV